MTHFASRFCRLLVPRLSFEIHNTLKQKTVIALLNSNKYDPYSNSSCTPKWMSSSSNSEKGEKIKLGDEVKFNFKLAKTGEIVEAVGRENETLMQVAVRSNIEMEGACEGSLCCTTCHIYVESEELFDNLPSPSVGEEDLLDIAPFLKENSRLSCQIVITKDMEGAVFGLPLGTTNMQVDKKRKER